MTPPPLVREQMPPMYAASLRLLMNVLPLRETQGCYNDRRGMITTRKAKSSNAREEVHSVAAFLDALLSELHEVTQCKQGIVAHGDPVFRWPGFHCHQDDASVELLLIDLDTSEGKKYEQVLCTGWGHATKRHSEESLCVCLKFVSSISSLQQKKQDSWLQLMFVHALMRWLQQASSWGRGRYQKCLNVEFVD